MWNQTLFNIPKIARYERSPQLICNQFDKHLKDKILFHSEYCLSQVHDLPNDDLKIRNVVNIDIATDPVKRSVSMHFCSVFWGVGQMNLMMG